MEDSFNSSSTFNLFDLSSLKDYRKGAPLYKFLNIQNEKGYYTVTDKTYAEYNRNIMHMPTLLVAPDLEEDLTFDISYLFRNTFYKDIHGNDLYVSDMVHIASHSLMNTVVGSIIFNPINMRYEVAIFKEGIAKDWPETVPLFEYSWELLPQDSLVIDFADRKYKFGTHITLDDLNICNSDITQTYRCESDLWRWDRKRTARQPYFKCKAIIQDYLSEAITPLYLLYSAAKNTLNTTEIIGYPFAYANCPDDYYMIPINTSDDTDTSSTRDEIKLIKSGSLCQCILPAISSDDIPSIFEGDKFISIKNPEIFGNLVYRPELAQYCVEIPEEVFPHDDLFDGYLPLTQEVEDPKELEDTFLNQLNDIPYKTSYSFYMQAVHDTIYNKRNWKLLWKLADI